MALLTSLQKKKKKNVALFGMIIHLNLYLLTIIATRSLVDIRYYKKKRESDRESDNVTSLICATRERQQEEEEKKKIEHTYIHDGIRV